MPLPSLVVYDQSYTLDMSTNEGKIGCPGARLADEQLSRSSLGGSGICNNLRLMQSVTIVENRGVWVGLEGTANMSSNLDRWTAAKDVKGSTIEVGGSGRSSDNPYAHSSGCPLGHGQAE